MSSTKQIAANRLNGRSSRGPVTKEGKNRSSLNAQKHGLYSQGVLLESESVDEFCEFAVSLRADLEPVGALENIMVRDIIALDWMRVRARRFEVEILNAQRVRIEGLWTEKGSTNSRIQYSLQVLERAVVDDPELHELYKSGKPPTDAEWERGLGRFRASGQPSLLLAINELVEFEKEPTTDGEAFIADCKNENALANNSRIATSLDRRFYKALQELRREQAARQGKKVPLPVALDVDVSGLEPQTN